MSHNPNSRNSKPKGHTSQPVDAIASRLLKTSKNPDVKSIAAAALSDTRLTPKTHVPVAHTRNRVASIAGTLLHKSPSKNVRTVAASVLSDHKQNCQQVREVKRVSRSPRILGMRGGG